MISLRPYLSQTIDIIILQQGKYRYRYEDVKGELNPFSVCIVPAGIRYNFNIEGNGTIAYLTFTPKYFLNYINSLDNKDLISFFTNKLPYSFLIFNNPSIQENLAPYLYNIINACKGKQDCIANEIIKLLNVINKHYLKKDDYIYIYNSTAHMISEAFEQLSEYDL